MSCEAAKVLREFAIVRAVAAVDGWFVVGRRVASRTWEPVGEAASEEGAEKLVEAAIGHPAKMAGACWLQVKRDGKELAIGREWDEPSGP